MNREEVEELIRANREMLAQTHSNQIHDREIAAMTRDTQLDEAPPADEELVVNRYEPADAAQARQI